MFLADGITSATLYCSIPLISFIPESGFGLLFELMYRDFDGVGEQTSVTAELYRVADFAEECGVFSPEISKVSHFIYYHQPPHPVSATKSDSKTVSCAPTADC